MTTESPDSPDSPAGEVAGVDWVLVPDVDELADAVNEAEDLLLALVVTEEDSAEEPEPWVMPIPLTGRNGALAAMQRISRALRAAVDALAWPAVEPSDSTRPRTYHGTYEHAPFRAVPIATTDRRLLAAAADKLELAASSRPAAGSPWERKRQADLTELLDQLADGESKPPTAAELIRPVLRISGLVNLPPDGASELLTGLLRASNHTGDNIDLDLDQAAAYSATASRINHVLTGGDPLARWAY